MIIIIIGLFFATTLDGFNIGAAVNPPGRCCVTRKMNKFRAFIIAVSGHYRP